MPNTCYFKISKRRSGYGWVLYAGNGVAVARSYRPFRTYGEAKEAVGIITWIFEYAPVKTK